MRTLILQISRRPDGKLNIDSDLQLPDLILALERMVEQLKKHQTPSGLYLPNGFEGRVK
jgi:hypothetical protein